MVLKNLSHNEVIVAAMQYESNYSILSAQYKQKEQEVKEAEESAKKAILSIQTLHKQQQALFDEFVLLRQRYDEQKASTGACSLFVNSSYCKNIILEQESFRSVVIHICENE